MVVCIKYLIDVSSNSSVHVFTVTNTADSKVRDKNYSNQPYKHYALIEAQTQLSAKSK